MTKSKTTRRSRSPWRTVTNHKGRSIAIVEATRGRRFELDADDWNAIRGSFGECWRVIGDGKGNEYVAAARPGIPSPLTPARAITQAGRHERVKYADGNTMNLKRENLIIVSGGGSHAIPASGYRNAGR